MYKKVFYKNIFFQEYSLTIDFCLLFNSV